MKSEIVDGQLIVSIQLENPPRVSATGKSKVVASSHGNQTTQVMIEGKPVIVGLNAYIKN